MKETHVQTDRCYERLTPELKQHNLIAPKKSKMRKPNMKKLKIPVNLDLEKVVMENPPEIDGFNFDKIYVICDAIYSNIHKLDPNTFKHAKKSDPFYVPLNGQILKHNLGARYYKGIIEWMIAVGIIECDGKYKDGITSLGYRFTDLYSGMSTTVDVTDTFLLRKDYYEASEDTLPKSHTVTKLEKWQLGLEIDVEEASPYVMERSISVWDSTCERYANNPVKREYELNKVNLRYLQMITIVDDLEHGRIPPIHIDSSGKRLHSIVTRMPKELKEYVTFKGEELAQTDIANSQLYFSQFLFDEKNWRNGNNYPHLKRIWEGILSTGNKPARAYSIMLSQLRKSPENKGFQDNGFSPLVSNGYIYEHLIELLDRRGDFFVREKSPQEKRHRVKSMLLKQIFADSSSAFSTLRVFSSQCRKMLSDRDRIMHRLLYQGNNKILWDTFVEAFPHVAHLFCFLKRVDHTDLSYVLQRIESTAVIEVACKKIMMEHPEIPLFTIHDCLVTTSQHIEKVDKIFKESIGEFIGTPPTTDIQHWSYNYYSTE